MTLLETIRERIRGLYRTDPRIHISVTISGSKIKLENEPATIKGVYPHFFRIEEQSVGFPRCHTLQYTDVLLHSIEIAELKLP